MGEYLILLDNGKILQADNKQLIFDKPVSEKAAMFLNYRNIFKCKVNKQNNNLYYLNSNNINFKIKSEIQLKNKTTICIKPQDIKIINPKYPLKPELQNNLFDGTITSETFYPTSVLLYFKVYGSENSYDFEIIIPNYIYKRYKLCKNKNIRISIWEPSIIIF
jgi:molybdate transport system ATP-binding protein